MTRPSRFEPPAARLDARRRLDPPTFDFRRWSLNPCTRFARRPPFRLASSFTTLLSRFPRPPPSLSFRCPVPPSRRLSQGRDIRPRDPCSVSCPSAVPLFTRSAVATITSLRPTSSHAQCVCRCFRRTVIWHLHDNTRDLTVASGPTNRDRGVRSLAWFSGRFRGRSRHPRLSGSEAALYLKHTVRFSRALSQ